MADYQYTGFDTYGYVEQIEFTPMNKECNVKYEDKKVIEPTLNEVDSFVEQTYPQQNILSIPKCKCLRK